MKASPCALCFSILLAGLSTAAPAAEVVLTAFEPFGGVPVNNSAEVMTRLAKRLRAASPEGTLRVKECILPVEYDRGAKIALECIGADRPELVLSFGAGGCEIDFETRAHNRDRTSAPDNAGVRRDSGAPIIPGAPAEISFNAPMDLIFRNSRSHGHVRLVRSTDPGNYVCNNTAYWLAHAFTVPTSATRFGFIHVPPTTCGANVAAPDALAETIFGGLRAALPELF